MVDTISNRLVCSICISTNGFHKSTNILKYENFRMYLRYKFNGLNNQDTTKDSSYQGMTDTVTVGITIAARTRVELADLAITARQTIEDYLQAQRPGDEDYDLVPNAITLQAGAVQYDSLKPCYWQELTYQCETNQD